MAVHVCVQHHMQHAPWQAEMERAVIDDAIATCDLGVVTKLLMSRYWSQSSKLVSAAGGLSGLLPRHGSVARLVANDVKVRAARYYFSHALNA